MNDIERARMKRDVGKMVAAESARQAGLSPWARLAEQFALYPPDDCESREIIRAIAQGRPIRREGEG